MCICVHTYIWVNPSYVAKARTPCPNSRPLAPAAPRPLSTNSTSASFPPADAIARVKASAAAEPARSSSACEWPRSQGRARFETGSVRTWNIHVYICMYIYICIYIYIYIYIYITKLERVRVAQVAGARALRDGVRPNLDKRRADTSYIYIYIYIYIRASRRGRYAPGRATGRPTRIYIYIYICIYIYMYIYIHTHIYIYIYIYILAIYLSIYVSIYIYLNHIN